jgi:hypothetical protein
MSSPTTTFGTLETPWRAGKVKGMLNTDHSVLPSAAKEMRLFRRCLCFSPRIWETFPTVDDMLGDEGLHRSQCAWQSSRDCAMKTLPDEEEC